MGSIVISGRSILLITALLLLSQGCDSRPTPEIFKDATATTISALDIDDTTSTLQTLPPIEEQIIATVLSVTDGDTLKVNIGGATNDIRLLGINAPEMDECWGPEAKVYLSGIVTGRELLLVSGEIETDMYGRLLRYVFIDDTAGPILVNSLMVEEGNAIGVTDGHIYESVFKALESVAYQSGLGMWGTLVCGDGEGKSADRPVIRVSEIQFDPQGDDTANLDDEYVTIINEGYASVALSGWGLRDESSSNRMTFPEGIVLSPGGSITVVTGCGSDDTDVLHWCSESPVWSNQGDTVIVSDTLGNAVIRHPYTSK